MKRLILLTLSFSFVAVTLSACGGGMSRSKYQDLEESPCACLEHEYEYFNGKAYKITKTV